MRAAQILNGRVHWIFEPLKIFGADELPELPHDNSGNPVVLVDITDRPEVKEGWVYDEISGGFSEPVIELPPEMEWISPPEPEPTNTELSENQLILMEAMATQYEENLANRLNDMEVQATIYETVLAIQEGGTV